VQSPVFASVHCGKLLSVSNLHGYTNSERKKPGKNLQPCDARPPSEQRMPTRVGQRERYDSSAFRGVPRKIRASYSTNWQGGGQKRRAVSPLFALQEEKPARQHKKNRTQPVGGIEGGSSGRTGKVRTTAERGCIRKGASGPGEGDENRFHAPGETNGMASRKAARGRRFCRWGPRGICLGKSAAAEGFEADKGGR